MYIVIISYWSVSTTANNYLAVVYKVLYNNTLYRGVVYCPLL